MSLGTDVKRYSRGTLPRIALVTVIVLPLLYGAMYLWAFWNPFNEVDKVPAALVNEDTGAVVDGKPLHVGDQVASALLDSGELGLHQVSAQEAADGVASGKYYFSVTLPEDFSQKVSSPAGDDPEQAKLQFTFNGANNYLASVIGQNAAEQVVAKVNAQVGEQTITTVLTGLTDAGDGLKQAADGAQRLESGLVSADDGAQQLATGARALSDGLNTASTGSAALAEGAAQLSDGVQQATGPLLNALETVAEAQLDPDAVADAAQHLSAAARSTTERVAALNLNYAQAAGIIDQAVTTLRHSGDPTLRDLGEFLAGAKRILDAKGIDPATDEGLATLRTRAANLENQLGDPGSQLRTFLTSAVDGSLRADVVKLRSGADQLKTGAAQLNSGLQQLSAGGAQLAGGAGQLADGTAQLRSGGAELADKLTAGSAEVPSWTPEQRTAVAQAVSDPVLLDLVHHNEVPTFGTGFAPFFLPLALFIGTLIIWMLLKPLQSRPIINGLGALRVVLASYWPALLIAVCQVVVMYTVVHFGVGLNARYPLSTVAFLILIAATFLALIQAFNAVFGVAVGRVVTLAFLMFQLVSAGGIYPVETTAKPFQVIHPFNPMTYAVNGLRELTVGGVDARLWTAIAVLSGVLAASLAVSSWAARRNRQYTMERLHPPIEV